MAVTAMHVGAACLLSFELGGIRDCVLKQLYWFSPFNCLFRQPKGNWNCVPVQLYWFSPFNVTETLDQYNIIDALGYGGGSCMFIIGAALLLSRQVTNCSMPYDAVAPGV